MAKASNAETVFVLCVGTPFTAGAERRADAGIFAVELVGNEPTLKDHWYASEDPNVVVPQGSLVSFDEHTVGFSGNAESNHDEFWILDFSTRSGQLLYEAEESFVLGQGSFSQGTQLLFVPHTKLGLLRYKREDSGELSALPTINVSPSRKLPPREIRILSLND
ncbi:MAG: hypothetical protein IPJ88_16205 [Myxococcales bacterium]|nr:MAG: hypothetical protein IPJ88_16205 [Myxococcales bacterium]